MSVKQKIEKLWVNVDKSIQRLSWRFGNGKFTPNQNDINALNGLITWVDDQRKITLNQNHLFAKLYIYFLNQHLDKYQSTVFDNIPQKELSRLLDMDLELFYESFTKSLNANEVYQTLEKNGIESKHPSLRSENEIQENKTKIENMSKADENKILSDVWEIEDVKEILNKSITESLNRFQ